MNRTYWTAIDSPLGTLWLTADDVGLTALSMSERDASIAQESGWIRDDAPFVETRRQLDEYFGGVRREFDLPLQLLGTSFQREVWAALQDIPYGQVRSYRDIAEQIGRPTAARAVGAANGSNPVSVIVPCHRVVGVSGRLTGYAWGLDRKRALLRLESEHRSAPAAVR
jgi:methylated-DNA-[protein]-cysteine S-methyltransferase